MLATRSTVVFTNVTSLTRAVPVSSFRAVPAITRVLHRPALPTPYHPPALRHFAQLATTTINPPTHTTEATPFNHPADPSTLSTTEHENLLFDVIARHPEAIEFKSRDSIRVIRAPLALEGDHIETSLTMTTLIGNGKMGCRPIIFLDDARGALMGFYHLGRNLAGHARIIHGGLQAVLLDECMARATFPRLPKKISVTATLTVDYKKPLPVDRFVILQAATDKVEGRKAWCEGRVIDAGTGEVYAEAQGLFVQPKWADKMAPIR